MWVQAAFDVAHHAPGVAMFARHEDLLAGADAMFARLDANGDGVLSEGEGRKARMKKRANRMR